MGEAAFEALILYRERSLTVEVAEKLREIAAAGIPILFVGGRPDRNPGYADHEQRDLAVREAITAIPGGDCADAVGVLAALAAAKVQPELGYDRPQPELGFIRKIDREDGSELFFLRNRTRDERTVSVTLTAGGRTPVLLDLWTGRMGTLADDAAGDDASTVVAIHPLRVQDDYAGGSCRCAGP